MIQKKQIIRFIASEKTHIIATDILLLALALGAVLAIGAIVPGLPLIFAPWLKRKKYTNTQFTKTAYYLSYKGLVEIKDVSGRKVIMLTKKGLQKVRSFDIEFLTLSQPRKWDTFWRVVIFDMPIHYNKARDAFRTKLKDLGFVQIQKSVWVYPYPCEEEVLFVADFFGITQFVEIMIVRSFLHEERVRRAFQL